MLGKLLAVLALALAGADIAVADETLAREMIAVAEAVDADWNERDARGLSEWYAADATLTLFARDRVERISGRGNVLDYFTASFARIPPEFRHRTQVQRVERLAGGTAVVDTHVWLSRQTPHEHRVIGEFTTITLLERIGADWKIVAVRAVAVPVKTSA